jgi:hypothetical protein
MPKAAKAAWGYEGVLKSCAPHYNADRYAEVKLSPIVFLVFLILEFMIFAPEKLFGAEDTTLPACQ